MALTTVIYTVCDVCSKSEDFMAEKGRCREVAKANGWSVIRVDNKLRDICPECLSGSNTNHLRQVIRGFDTAARLAEQENTVYGGQVLTDVPAERLLNP